MICISIGSRGQPVHSAVWITLRCGSGALAAINPVVLQVREASNRGEGAAPTAPVIAARAPLPQVIPERVRENYKFQNRRVLIASAEYIY